MRGGCSFSFLQFFQKLHRYNVALTPFAVLIYSNPLCHQTAPVSAVPQDSPQQLVPKEKLSLMNIHPCDTFQLFLLWTCPSTMVFLHFSNILSPSTCWQTSCFWCIKKKKKGFIVEFWTLLPWSRFWPTLWWLHILLARRFIIFSAISIWSPLIEGCLLYF